MHNLIGEKIIFMKQILAIKLIQKYVMNPRDCWLAYSVRRITRMMTYKVACRLRKSRDVKTNKDLSFV